MNSMRDLKALLLVTVFLIADMSALASASPVLEEFGTEEMAVSYTHLTLPTILRV